MVLQRLRGDGWGRAVRLLAPLGSLVVEGVPGLLGALLVQEGGLWLAGRLSAPCQRVMARRLFLAAFGLRVALTLPTHYIAKLGDGNGALFKQDDYTNDLVGEWLVRIARGDGIAIFPGHLHLLDGIYPFLLMSIYAIFGYAPLLPKLLNAGLAALCSVLVFDMARRIFRPPAASIAALGAAVLPTMVVWSIATLKETLVLFVALAGLRAIQFLTTAPPRSSRVIDALVFLFGALLLLLDLRSTTTAILLGLLAIVYLARSYNRPRLRSWHIVFAALAVVVLVGGGLVYHGRTSNRPPTAVLEDAMLLLRHRRAQEAASARSQVRPEVAAASRPGSELPAAEAASDAQPFNVLNDVLDPLGYALLAPVPWQAHSLLELGASAEMPFWYVLLAASPFAWRASPRQKLFLTCLAVYGIANWLVLAATEGNFGNLVRHRLLLDPTLLILGGAGLDWLWVRMGRPFLARTPPLLTPARGES